MESRTSDMDTLVLHRLPIPEHQDRQGESCDKSRQRQQQLTQGIDRHDPPVRSAGQAYRLGGYGREPAGQSTRKNAGSRLTVNECLMAGKCDV